jgi:UDP-GlcNAc:undecaprenyl-phosphate/decaprenyl-phosphate GlcNAc-1-phosphate transferase
MKLEREGNLQGMGAIPLAEFLTAAVLSFLGSAAIARWGHLHLAWAADGTSGVQKIHVHPVPRIGGVAVILAFGLICLLDPLGPVIVGLIAGAAIALVGGLVEDVTGKFGPGARLAVTLIAATTTYALTGAAIVRLDMPMLDSLLHWNWFAVPFTLLAVAGVAHSINLVDGHNGLSAGIAIVALAAFAVLAGHVGDSELARVSILLIAALAGFLALNFPYGRLFMGDGGAYSVGFVLAFLGVLLVMRHDAVSPWFPLAVLALPVWETIFSALRRMLWDRTHPGDPDSRHLHSLIYRKLAWRLVPDDSSHGWRVRNVVTVLPLWGVSVFMAVVALLNAHSTPLLMIQAWGFAVAYCLVYVLLARLPDPVMAKDVTWDEADSPDLTREES